MSKFIASLLIVSCAIFAARAGFAAIEEFSASPIIVESDTGRIGGSVQLEALPSPTDSNRIRKLFTIEDAGVLEPPLPGDPMQAHLESNSLSVTLHNDNTTH